MSTCTKERQTHAACRLCHQIPTSPAQPVYLWRALSGWAAARGECGVNARANLLRDQYILRRYSDKESAIAEIRRRHPAARIRED